MSQLEFVGTKVPSEWIQKLKQLTEETGKTQSAIVHEAIAAAIGVNDVNPVNPLREELDDLKARVQALEELTQLSMVNRLTKVNLVNQITTNATKSSTPTPPIAGAMTIGQLHRALQSLGYPSTQKTLGKHLRKAIKIQQLPDDLIGFGVVAHWEIRRSANRFSNQVKWLSIGH
jgi:predicted DNA-binding protein